MKVTIATYRIQSSFMRFTLFYNQPINAVSPEHLKRSKYRRWITPLSAIAIIGLGTSLWVVSEAISPTPRFAHASQLDRASTKMVDLYVERWPRETYDHLWRRAQEAAVATAQQNFDSNRQTSKVVIMVTAENNGSVAPIFTLEVSRGQWERGLQSENWITNVPSSRFLLGFEKPKSPTVDAFNSEPGSADVVSTPAPGSPL